MVLLRKRFPQKTNLQTAAELNVKQKTETNLVKLRLLTLTAILIPTIGQAGTVNLSDALVTSVMSGYQHKGIFINLNKAVPNPANCANNSNEPDVVAAIPSHGEVSHVLSLALAAKAMGNVVDLQIYDDICLEGWPVLRRIKVK